MRIQVEIIFQNQMDNMSRDLSIIIYLQHRVVLTYGMPHGIHTKRTPVAAEHTASRYQNDKLMQYQIGKKGP
jgi:hypothetical protein